MEQAHYKSEFTVLVPSAALVPDGMRELGDLPPVVYPIDGGIVLDEILSSFDGHDAEYDIVLCEGAEAAIRRIETKTSGRIRVTLLESSESLADTLLQGFERVSDDRPVIVNFGDTAATGELAGFEGDCYYYADEPYSSSWTFFTVKDGAIAIEYDKDRLADREGGVGSLFVGVFKFGDPALFRRLLAESVSAPSEGCSAFYRALSVYSELRPMEPLRAERWLDIGHRDKYADSRLQVKAREFNHIGVDAERGIVRKSSDDADKLIDEISWYLKLPSGVAYVAPRVFGYSLDRNDPYVELEYYPYHTLHSLFLDAGLTHAKWTRIFRRLRFLVGDMERYRVDAGADDVRRSLEEMYVGKTLRRLSSLRGSGDFAGFFEREVAVNGRRYPSIERVMGIIAQEIPGRLCEQGELVLIHGDLCFTNILVDDTFSFVRLVDPRGRFGAFDIYGDPRYELAKLAHSADGKYDFIIKDRFDAEWDANSATVRFEVDTSSLSCDVYGCLKDCFGDILQGRLVEIELIEALLFLSMVPLHGESVAHQMAMLGTGLELLNRAVGIELL